MRRLTLLVFLASISIAASALAQPLFHARSNNVGCDFQVLQQLSCDNDLDRGVPSVCTITFQNKGTAACVGHFAGYIGPATLGTVDSAQTTGITTACRAVGLTPLPATLTPPGGGPVSVLETAELCEGDGTVAVGANVLMTGRIVPAVTYPPALFVVGSTVNYAGSITAIVGTFALANCNLALSAPSVSQSGVPYSITWSAAAAPTTYEVQEATQSDFSDAKTQTTSSTSQQFTHTATTPATFYYRVRATSCRSSLGPYSITAQTIITPAQDATSKTFDLVVPVGSTTVVVQQVRFDGLTPNVPYTASVDKPYLTVVPSTGNVGGDGSVTLTVRGDPSTLGVGANSGTVTITTGLPKTGGRIVSLDTNTQSTTISITVATPVTQTPKTPPPAATLIVPAVAHRDGIGTQFISDIRLANVNTSGASSSYQLTFTSANSDGSKSGRQTQLNLVAGQTAALNDVLHDFFGLATSAADASGVLEIRTLGTPVQGTVAASRTYSVSGAGTYGQFIAAVPIDRIASAPASGETAQPLILSHVGQTIASRMNLGLVEALGFPTTGHIRAFSASGDLLGDFPFTLRAFEQQQINSFLARNGIATANAHVEVSVDAPVAGTTSGGVTTYASLLDNNTHDASVITGIKASSLTSNRYVVPGVTEASTSGDHSEVRVLNAGTSSVDATLTFYPEGGGTPTIRNVSIAAGQVQSYDSIVSSLFGRTSGRGSLVVTTQTPAPLLVTSRTYSAASQGGTYGQFQTAITVADGIGSGESELQLLQLEESAKFHTNIGIAELSGNPVDVLVTLIAPDSKASVSTTVHLEGNGSLLQPVIASLTGGSNVYNARVAVKVVGGTGRVAAYGSLLDKATNDPTLVPAQR